MTRVWRFAFSGRWWVGHLLVAAAAVTCLALGDWQWDRSQSATGDWQNLGYALQWPLFAAVLIAGWLRFLWLEHKHQRRRGADVVNRAPAAQDSPARQPAHTADPAPRPARTVDPTIQEGDPDDELAAYNAYLARLAEEDRRR